MKKTKINIPLLKMVLGILSMVTGFVFLLSFISYFFHWKEDQSQLESIADRTVLAQNLFGKLGAWLGDTFIQRGVGAAAILIALFLIAWGIRLVFKIKKIHVAKWAYHVLFFLIWLPVFFGLLFSKNTLLAGRMGFEINEFLYALIDTLGIALLLLVSLVLYVVLEWKITPEVLQKKLKKEAKEATNVVRNTTFEDNTSSETETKLDSSEEQNSSTPTPFVGTEITDEELEPHLKSHDSNTNGQLDSSPKHTAKLAESAQEKAQTTDAEEKPQEISLSTNTLATENSSQKSVKPNETEEDMSFVVEKAEEEEVVEENLATDLVQKHGEYDPRLDLPHYKLPTIDLLNDHAGGQNVTIDQSELEANKNKIVETLGNYKIGIESIKATIGPTVTLYEIVPEAGVRISKIKNLEDDIALSLSALGIRIIAPIPGKGTIGIEVPNGNPTIVSMRSVIASQKFQSSDMELPVAFGKNISNETFIADLAKMPHLLMAGATGQGKSVGLNAIITSLLYKKHPAELKFVMVDPKKVELALYNKIERHYLAKLPDSEDAIITDNTKVINTLNSLCIEMDDRYELLKDAYVRNIKEYNQKFKQRKLNPEKGHRFMPYIVLVVDEFADLIMTAGKEVETPIARLAQLARAVGIHLIIATQRPSVNVITGIIKANFPARVAFRVTSKVDSRTILDAGGAEQLIGKGDMLFTKGNDLVRLQCAFVDTPEVDDIADFIGNQRGYSDAFMLPEYVGEDGGGGSLDIDPSDRDALFEEAARVIVAAQQGSASLLQRKMKIGYNRAGRIIDQLEAAGIVGPFEGSKARDVLVMDEMSLEQLLKNQE